MKYLNFKKNIYHIFLSNELILLDLNDDRFFFFDNLQSNTVKKLLLNNYSENDDFILEFKEKFLFWAPKTQTIVAYDDIIGIDNYSWSNTKFYLNHESNIRILDKILIVLLYFTVFLVDKKYLLKSLKSLKSLKISKSLGLHSRYIEKSATFIHKTSKYLPFNLKCLEFSLVLSLFIILKGGNSTLNIGVQKYDFLSHAWVEVDNKVVADRNDLNSSLAVILSI